MQNPSQPLQENISNQVIASMYIRMYTYSDDVVILDMCKTISYFRHHSRKSDLIRFNEVTVATEELPQIPGVVMGGLLASRLDGMTKSSY